MRKLFQVWLTLTIASLAFYIPIYVFSNNALDAAEELTPQDLIPITGTTYDDPERKAQIWESLGIDMSMELIDALDDNKRLSDVEFDYVEGPEARTMLLATGLQQVKASAKIDENHQLNIVFGVQPKAFMRSVAQVHGILTVQISNGEHSMDFIQDDDVDIMLFSLFETSGKGGLESVDRMVKRFDARLARQLASQSPQVTESDPHTTAHEDDASEPVAPINTDADYSEPDQPAASDQVENQTVAGNPSADKIIIFQFEGKPAYCADEGVDGPNCRGDAASWIGAGTYKEFMDADSATCIAGEANCRVPQYFPADIRG